MKIVASPLVAFLAFLFITQSALAVDDKSRLEELDAYWTEVSRSVREGDFEGYQATCHETGVLVSGSKKISQPLSEALSRWKKDFVATATGKMKANVEFRLSQRFGDSTTAHETGIFCYSTVDAAGNSTAEYIHFEGLLVKLNGKWQILMEYQKSRTTAEQWQALR
jgi:hypothetical protein